MRKNFGPKPWSYPQPVLIVATYDEDGNADAMNAAWGGISDDCQISICLSADHKTVKNLRRTGAFTVSMATADHTAQCDYLGLESANHVPDKLERCGLHTTRSAAVNAPLIDELPMALECRLLSYNAETMLAVGEIVNVCADMSVLTNGQIDPAKLRPITFDPVNNTYIELGAVSGRAFHDGLRYRRSNGTE